MAEQAQRIDKMAWIHIVDKKILSTRSQGKDLYYIPGGKREPGESDHETLIREICEELSVDLIADTIEFVGQFEAPAHDKPAGVIVQMRCYTGDYIGTIAADNEIAEVVWLSYADRDKSAPVDRKIMDYLKEQGWIE
ncbi:MAG: NUDIX domain-containing protein [Chloroflexi bacterium]|nr:MAG: NUDIX domain-containing protein [Chloroflexota bacterium]